MTVESIRGLVQLAVGLGELTRARAVDAAQALLAVPGAGVTEATAKAATRASELADELMASAMANRAHLQVVVREEVEGAAERLGVVRSRDLAQVKEEVAQLRARVTELAATASCVPVKKAATKRAAAQRQGGRQGAASTMVATQPGARNTAKRTAAQKGTVQKGTAAQKGTVQKGTAVQKGTVQKGTARAGGAPAATPAARTRPPRTAFRSASDQEGQR